MPLESHTGLLRRGVPTQTDAHLVLFKNMLFLIAFDQDLNEFQNYFSLPYISVQGYIKQYPGIGDGSE